mgnify:FL=1
MPRKAMVKVQSATSTNTKLALATAALLIASGLAFIAAPSVRGPGAQAKCGLNSFEFRGPGTAHGTCYSGKKVTASIRGAKSQTLRTNLTAQCLAECLNCPAGYEAVAGKDSDCLISCVKAKPQKRKTSQKRQKNAPSQGLSQIAAGTCINENEVSSPEPNSTDYFGHLTSCPNSQDPEPGSTTQWRFDSDCSTGQVCTFQCDNNLVLDEDNYCARCQEGFVPNEDNTQCVCPTDSFAFRGVNDRLFCWTRAECEAGPGVCPNEETGMCEACPTPSPELSQVVSGSCVDQDGNIAQEPNDGVEVCRGHDGSENDIVWSGPGPGAASEYCDSNNLDAPCSYRCASGERVNPDTHVCEIFCQNGLVPNADSSACECGPGLYYSTQYNHCMSRESCVGGDDLIVNDSTRECHTCEGQTIPNDDHTICVCPSGSYLESEYNSCWSYETCEGADNMQANSSSVPWTCDRI